MEKKRVLIICRNNSARSQMAEGLLRSLYGGKYDVFSAGTEPTGVNPYAIIVMSEIGIDITTHRSKSMEEYYDQSFDYIITVCDTLKGACPVFPGNGIQIHKSFEDPAAEKGSQDKILASFRNVRNQIKTWLIKEFGNK